MVDVWDMNHIIKQHNVKHKPYENATRDSYNRHQNDCTGNSCILWLKMQTKNRSIVGNGLSTSILEIKMHNEEGYVI